MVEYTELNNESLSVGHGGSAHQVKGQKQWTGSQRDLEITQTHTCKLFQDQLYTFLSDGNRA